MTTYNFYARPKDPKDLIMVTPQKSIHELKFILIYTGKVNDYDLVNEPLTKDCLVEEHHYYNILRLNWLKKHPQGDWEDSDTIPFGFSTSLEPFIKGIRKFLNKRFKIKKFVRKLKSDSDFKEIVEILFGNDIDYLDMYFDRKNDWSLTSVQYKGIRTVNYKKASD